jgi:cyclopropane fatty-acyl-phospholipid synthase-like methyltransferase
MPVGVQIHYGSQSGYRTSMDLKPSMRVLDLGCGRAMSSIFLHREFDVQVWAVDLLF